MLKYFLVPFRSIYDSAQQKHTDQPSKKKQEDERVPIEPSARKVGQGFIFLLNTHSQTTSVTLFARWS